MKTILTMLVFVMITALSAGDLLDAISVVESNRNDRAVGDKGNAVGRYQLWRIYVDDVNRIAKTNYTYEDRTDPVKAKEMVSVYIEHYAKRYVRITGKPITDEVRARIHNGGPNGWKKTATIKYWQKVEKEMKK